MTAPDFREWIEVTQADRVDAAIRQKVQAMRERGATWGRYTMVYVADGQCWLCADGWKVQPDDQGPEPTAADIPVGFV